MFFTVWLKHGWNFSKRQSVISRKGESHFWKSARFRERNPLKNCLVRFSLTNKGSVAIMVVERTQIHFCLHFLKLHLFVYGFSRKSFRFYSTVKKVFPLCFRMCSNFSKNSWTATKLLFFKIKTASCTVFIRVFWHIFFGT